MDGEDKEQEKAKCFGRKLEVVTVAFVPVVNGCAVNSERAGWVFGLMPSMDHGTSDWPPPKGHSPQVKLEHCCIEIKWR